MRALQALTRCQYFAVESGRYRYYYYPAQRNTPSVLKIQMRKQVMAAFRASPQGQAVERLADIIEVGGGWWEVRSADLYKWRITFGTRQDGMKMWLRELNLSEVRGTNANTEFITPYEARHTSKHNTSLQVAQEEPVTHQLVERLRAAYQVDPAKLEALANKFKPRHH